MAVVVETYQFNDRRQGWIFTTESTATNYLPIRRASIPLTGDLLKNALIVTVAGDRADEQPWAAWLAGVENLGSVSLVITRGTDVIYRGSMVSISSDTQVISMQFTDRYRLRRGVRRRYQRNCNFQLYEPTTCKAVAASLERSISSFVGSTVRISNAPDDIAEYAQGQLLHRGSNRYWILEANAMGEVVCETPVLSAAIGDDVTLFKGCNKSLDHCMNRFNNVSNYGGFPHIPEISPFGQVFGEDRTR